jgi:hypothetical protein
MSGRAACWWGPRAAFRAAISSSQSSDARFGREGDADGDGVDEQPHHPLRALQPGGAPVAHRPEHRLGASRVAPQQERPRPLHHGVHEHAAVALQGAERGVGRGREAELARAEVRLGARIAGRAPDRPHGGRRFEAPEDARPVRLVRRAVPLPQPPDVVAERAGDGQRGLRVLHAGVVQREHLAQDPDGGPPVEQDVVDAPHQHVLIRRPVEEGQAHGRRLRQVEAAGTVLGQVALHRRFPVGGREPRAVAARDLQPDLGDHFLDRLRDIRPAEAGPEDVVPRHHAAPRPLQPLRVRRLAEAADYLLHVDPRLGRQQRPKEHPVLERSERIPLLDADAAGVAEFRQALYLQTRAALHAAGGERSPRRLG